MIKFINILFFILILNACDSKSCDNSNSNNNNQENIDIEPATTKPDSSKKPEISTKSDGDTNIISVEEKVEEKSEKITPKIVKPLPTNTEEEIKNNLTKAIEDNNESLFDGVQRKFITPEVVETAVKKGNILVIKKLYAINGDIFKDKNNPLFLSSSNKEIKQFIAKNSSHEAKEKYVKTNLKTDDGIENLKKTFTDLEPSTINGFLWPIKDDGVKIAPRSILKDTLIKNDDSDKFSKLLEINIDLDKKDNDGNNLLHYAAQQNKPKVFKVLFDKKNSLLTTKNNAKNTPLQTALKTNSKDVIKFIINNAVLDEEEQKEIIVYALTGMVNQSDKKEVLEELVKKYPKIFNSSITLNNKSGLALFLTKNYADFVYENTDKIIIHDDVIDNLDNSNYVNNFIDTIRTLSKDNASELLHYNSKNSLMAKFINDDNSYLLKKLTKLSDIDKNFGAITNLDTSVFRDAQNNNILHQAALLNKPEIFKEFLDKTMLNAKNTDGKTALEIALEGKNSQIITSLLNNRYKIDMDDKSYQEIIKNNHEEWVNLVISVVKSGNKNEFENLAKKDPDIYRIVDRFNQPLLLIAQNHDLKEMILDKTPAEIIKNRIISQKSDSFLSGLNQQKRINKTSEIIKDYIDNFNVKNKEFTEFINYCSKAFVTHEIVAYTIEKNNFTAFKQLNSKKGNISLANIDKILVKKNFYFIYFLLTIIPYDKDNHFYKQIDNIKYANISTKITENHDFNSLQKLSKLSIFNKIKNKYFSKDSEQKNILVYYSIKKAIDKNTCNLFKQTKNESEKPKFTKKIVDFLQALSDVGVEKESFKLGILQDNDGKDKLYPGCMNENNTAWYFKEVQDKLIELSQD